MTAVVEREVHFGLLELDLLATHAGVPFPFPLRVPSFGRLAAERDRLLAEAAHLLRTRGLAAGHGPLGVAADLVTALREHRGAVDLVVIGPGTATGTVAMVHRTGAVVCSQSFGDGAPDTVRVRRLDPTEVADELAGAVPATPAAVTMPITLPPGVVGGATRLLEDVGDDDVTARQRVRDLVRAQGGDPAVVDRLAGLLPSLTGRGQLGATRRTPTGSGRVGAELSWLDGPRGRVRIDQTGDGWTSVNPLRQQDFRRAAGVATALAGD
ncbi:ESX secretion-associated protein EspG [Saccharothrix deserti]|uniref:ESX secretion-associated protein EspG n=1 Tax=Saccharothrix deserti TaxID=2593674 RepID=UPI00131C5098|nr:ESX secretion-associated protein EspG [Saccharothrix deserti]